MSCNFYPEQLQADLGGLTCKNTQTFFISLPKISSVGSEWSFRVTASIFRRIWKAFHFNFSFPQLRKGTMQQFTRKSFRVSSNLEGAPRDHPPKVDMGLSVRPLTWQTSVYRLQSLQSGKTTHTEDYRDEYSNIHRGAVGITWVLQSPLLGTSCIFI